MSEPTVPAEIVEKAAKADFCRDKPADCTPWESVTERCRESFREPVRRALEPVYADIQADALREAAEEWAEGAWADEFMLAGVVDDVTAVQATDAWLNARADRLAGGGTK